MIPDLKITNNEATFEKEIILAPGGETILVRTRERDYTSGDLGIDIDGEPIFGPWGPWETRALAAEG